MQIQNKIPKNAVGHVKYEFSAKTGYQMNKTFKIIETRHLNICRYICKVNCYKTRYQKL